MMTTTTISNAAEPQVEGPALDTAQTSFLAEYEAFSGSTRTTRNG